MSIHHRIVICLTKEALDEPWLVTPAVPGFFSKSFQNFRLSSAAAARVVSATSSS